MRPAPRGGAMPKEEAPQRSYLEEHDRWSDEGIPNKELERYSIKDLEDAYDEIDDQEREKMERELEEDMRNDEARVAAQKLAERFRLRGEAGYNVETIPDPEDLIQAQQKIDGHFPVNPLEMPRVRMDAKQLAERIRAQNDSSFFLKVFDPEASLPPSTRGLEDSFASWRHSKVQRTPDEWKRLIGTHVYRYYEDMHETEDRMTQVYLVSVPLFVYVVLRGKDKYVYETHYYCWSQMHTVAMLQANEALKKKKEQEQRIAPAAAARKRDADDQPKKSTL